MFPGPVSQTFKFCHWNLNSICAREKVFEVSLIEDYNSLHQYAEVTPGEPSSEHASPPSEGEKRFFRRFLAFILP